MLKAGFSRVNVNPMMGIEVAGYFIQRLADGILDDLEANTVSISLGDKRQVFVSVDSCHLEKNVIAEVVRICKEKYNIPEGTVHINATHTHTSPHNSLESDDPLIKQYSEMLVLKLVDAVKFAIDDEKPAKLGFGKSHAPHIGFCRRFIMKDGSIRTNPGAGNPNILKPISEIDQDVSVLRFDREGANTIVMVNYANHPDVVGGCKLSADWPGFARRIFEKAIDNTSLAFYNGALGDINHVNVFPKGGDNNDLTNDFDDVMRGYGHARHMGNVVAAAVMQVYDKVEYVEPDSFTYKSITVNVPANKAKEEELPEAIRINDLHNAGRDNELPYEGMELTTVVAEAGRMVNMMNAPDYFGTGVSAAKLGRIGFITMPGEAFSDIQVALKKAEGYDCVFVIGLADEYSGYFPMMSAYDEGGYEARSSRFRAGVGELYIEEGKKLLESL